MPLTPIGNIASEAIPEKAVLSWETATEWDNGVSEEYVQYEDGEIELIEGADSFERGSGVPDAWTVDGSAQTTTNRALDGNVSVKSTSGFTDIERFFDPEVTPSQIEYSYNETSNSNGHHFVVRRSDKKPLFGCGTGNPQSFYIGDGSDKNTVSTIDHNYNEWVTYTFTNIDFESETFDVEIVTQESGSQKTTGVSFNNSASGIEEVELGDNLFDAAGGIQSTYHDLVWGTLTDGSLTTATKSFPFPAKPDIQGLDYLLNGGGIDVDVIGSPDTASEEVVTQSLDGASAYSPSWSNAHTDFRVRIRMTSPDRTTTPLLSRTQLGAFG